MVLPPCVGVEWIVDGKATCFLRGITRRENKRSKSGRWSGGREEPHCRYAKGGAASFPSIFINGRASAPGETLVRICNPGD
jgi:hypothetical protein